MRDMVLISNLKAAFEQDSQDSQDLQDYRIRSIPTIVLNAIGLQVAICNCPPRNLAESRSHTKSQPDARRLAVNQNANPGNLDNLGNPARIPNHNQMQGDWP